MAYNNGPRIITDGLILCLDAGNNKSYPGSGTAWRDLSGNNNSGTLINSPVYNTANSGLLNFDGIEDYATIPSISSTIAGFSISLWINASRWALSSCPCPNRSGIVDWSTGYWNYTSIISGPSGPDFVIYNQSTSPVGSSITFNASSTNVWYYLVATFGPSGVSNSLKTYVNGILINSSTLTGQGGEFTVTASPIIAAYNRHCGYCYLEAKIPQIKFYNRPLTPQEILQNFNATRGRFGI